MRLNRSSLRKSSVRAGLGLCAVVTLGLCAACGATGAATATPTAVPATSVAPVVAASPQRPTFASPLPSPSAAVASAATPSTTTTTASDAGSTDYEVASGDTLLSIADKTLGDQTQWRRIYDANKDTIGSDPDKLKVGMKLKIPPKQ